MRKNPDRLSRTRSAAFGAHQEQRNAVRAGRGPAERCHQILQELAGSISQLQQTAVACTAIHITWWLSLQGCWGSWEALGLTLACER